MTDGDVTVTQFPHSRENEAALIGAILINPDAYYDVVQFLHADDFYIHRHRWIWEAFTRLSDRHSPIDILTVSQDLDQQGRLGEAGGPAYLTGLINLVPTSMHAEAYAHVVEQQAIRRRLLDAANQAARLAYDGELSVEEALDGAEKAMLSAGERVIARSAKPLSQIVSNLYDKVAQASQDGHEMLGLPSGFTDLDKLLKGFQPGNLVIVAGRPGTGKTSFMLSLARNVAKTYQRRIALFSLEMADEELAYRLIAQEGGIDSQRLRTGQLKENEWPLFAEAVSAVSELPLLIDDAPLLTPIQLRAKCRRLHMEQPLDLVIVDYLQLMAGGGRFENRQAEVAFISRQLKALAKELGIPVLAAAQLSRAVEGRADKKPMLSDLRESGSIEQDADIVIFLSRQADGGAMVDVELAKHRNGPTGLMQLVYRPTLTKFENAVRRES